MPAAPGAHFGDIWSVSDHVHKMGTVAGRQEEHGEVFEILELEDYMRFGWKGVDLFLVIGEEEDDNADCQKHDGVDKYHHGI